MKAALALLAAAILAPSIAFAGSLNAVPEAGSTLSFLGLAITGLVFLRRKFH
jgi:protein with PEP-CTERM/exosortase system signal